MINNTSLLVTIVAYNNSCADLEKVIDLFCAYPFSFDIKLAIIDNSKIATLKTFCERRSIDYFRPNFNIGFGAGHNFAIMSGKYKPQFCLILNPDVFISPNAIAGVVEYMKKNKNIVLSSPRLLNIDGSIQGICRFYPTVPRLINRIFYKYILNGSISIEESMDLSKIPLSVPSLHGACFFVRYDSFVNVGGFDNNFFLYLEDIDLCKRLSFQGDISYIPLFHATHIHAKGSRRKFKLLIAHVKSFLLYFIKHGFFIKR